MRKSGGLSIVFFFLFSTVLLAQEAETDSLSLSLNNSKSKKDTSSTAVLADATGIDSLSTKVTVKSANQEFLEGIKNFKENDYLDAIGAFNNSIGGISDNRKYLYRGRAFLCAGKYENAIKDFMQYNKTDPAGASWDLARTYAAMKSPGIAIEHLKNNLASPYKIRWSMIMKDTLFMQLQEDPIWKSFTDQQIVSDAEKAAIEAEKKMKGEFYREALSHASTALEYEPKNPDYYKLRAGIYTEMGKYEEAVKDYKKELSLAPHRMTDVYKDIAYIYVRKGDLKTASTLLSEIIKKDQMEFLLLLDVAEIELERYNTKGALKAIDQYLKEMPDDDEAYFLRANILDGEQAKKDVNKAISLCKASKKKVPQKYYMLQSSMKK